MRTRTYAGFQVARFQSTFANLKANPTCETQKAFLAARDALTRVVEAQGPIECWHTHKLYVLGKFGKVVERPLFPLR